MKGRSTVMFGIILAIVGTALCLYSAQKVDFNFEKLREDKQYVKKSENAVIKNKIYIDSKVANIAFSTYDGEEILVDYSENKDAKVTITQEEDRLSIVQTYRWQNFNLSLINWWPEELYLNLKLPTGYKGDIDIESDTGNVTIKSIDFTQITIKTSTGNVKLENLPAVDQAQVKTSTGNIKSTKVTANNIKLDATTGNIDILDTTADELNLKTSTGDINIGKEDSFLMINNKINASATTGNIKFYAQCPNIILKTSTGNIRGIILGNKSDYKITAHTNTGSNNLTSRSEGIKNLEARASTGNINITWKA